MEEHEMKSGTLERGSSKILPKAPPRPRSSGKGRGAGPKRGKRPQESGPQEQESIPSQSPPKSRGIALVHVPDLHVGYRARWTRKPQRNESKLPNPVPTWSGHSQAVAEDLAAYCWKLRQEVPKTYFAILGDLTRIGLKDLESDPPRDEFETAREFIEHEWNEPGVRAGLRLASHPIHPDKDWNGALIIPGNHDYWGGYPWGVETPEEDGFLRPGPWSRVIELSSRHRAQLHVVGLDSCYGLPPLSLQQILAKGVLDGWTSSRDGQLELAREHFDRLAQEHRDSTSIRVVVVHHPPGELQPSTEQAFQEFLDACEVDFVLCGHTHERAAFTVGRTHVLCAGTALQCGISGHFRPGLHYNHFFLHRVTATSPTDYRWSAFGYFHAGRSWKREDTEKTAEDGSDYCVVGKLQRRPRRSGRRRRRRK